MAQACHGFVCTYVKSTYYLILTFILFGTPHGQQKKRINKLTNKIKKLTNKIKTDV